MLKKSLRGNKLYKERVQISVKELRIGMYVAKLDIPWDQSPFLVRGFRIKNEQTLSQLRAACRYVYIDVVKSRVEGLKPERIEMQPFSESVDQAFKECKPIYDRSILLLKSIFESRHLDKESLELAKSLVGHHVDSAFKNPAVLRWLSLTDSHSSYLVDHTLRVTILSIMLGMEVGLERQELEELGLAALMHDMGMMQVPQAILSKKDELSIDEISLIQKHPLFSLELLRADNDFSSDILEAIVSHHERLDGQGYPAGKSSYDIPYLSKIIAIADTFDSQTSDRSYRSGSSSLEALKTLMALRGSHYDEALVIKFIRVIGVYPVGSVVEIDDGRLGLVLPTLLEDSIKPNVLIVTGPDGQSIEPYTLRLIEDDAVKISKVLPDGSQGVFFEDFAQSIL
ncbi:MAG: HD-GYP domain-containing protein [Candidatus Pelagadaptatus aseana]|uniref:HD-GYP domain-containing protein n=1 Tax=Candidatus Pelagadaptatus aseana TaxID=3120508 RepID=UPI0039B341E2